MTSVAEGAVLASINRTLFTLSVQLCLLSPLLHQAEMTSRECQIDELMCIHAAVTSLRHMTLPAHIPPQAVLKELLKTMPENEFKHVVRVNRQTF